MLLFDLSYLEFTLGLGPCLTVHERKTNRQLRTGERLKHESHSEIPRLMLALGREASESVPCPFYLGSLETMLKGSLKRAKPSWRGQSITEKCIQKLLLQRRDQLLELFTTPSTPPSSLVPMSSGQESFWSLVSDSSALKNGHILFQNILRKVLLILRLHAYQGLNVFHGSGISYSLYSLL